MHRLDVWLDDGTERLFIDYVDFVSVMPIPDLKSCWLDQASIDRISTGLSVYTQTEVRQHKPHLFSTQGALAVHKQHKCCGVNAAYAQHICNHALRHAYNMPCDIQTIYQALRHALRDYVPPHHR